jgi:hypothetical protein
MQITRWWSNSTRATRPGIERRSNTGSSHPLNRAATTDGASFKNCRSLSTAVRYPAAVPLHADHSMVVKFDTRNAAGYRTAVDKLRQFLKEEPSLRQPSSQNPRCVSIVRFPSPIVIVNTCHSHSMVVKFDTRNAAGYRTAVDKLRQFLKDAPSVVAH